MRWLCLLLTILVYSGCSTHPSEDQFSQFDTESSCKYLKSEKAVLRIRAAKRLKEIGDDSAIVLAQILDGFESEPNPKVRQEYVRCLTILVHSRHEKELANREIDNQVVKKLSNLLKRDENPDVRTTAGIGYAVLADPDADDPNAFFASVNVIEAIERDRNQTVLFYAVALLLAILFVPFAALVFSVGTLGLGVVFSDFAVSGPENWKFRDFYLRYLILAAVFTFVSLPIMMSPIPFSLWIAFGILAATFNLVFSAGWLHAIIIGGGGGFIGLFLFVKLLNLVPLP